MKHLIAALFLLTAACQPYTQTSSGMDYISRVTPAGKMSIDPEIARVANVEPNLRFPAKFGVARIVNGRLTTPPASEAAQLADFAERNQRYGQFVPVSPLIAAMVTEPVTDRYNQPHDVLKSIRLAAARQHIDHVLIYEIGASSAYASNVLALADITIIGGAFLPTRSHKAMGMGQVLLVDVRNGYTYGTAQMAVDLSKLSPTWGARNQTTKLRERAASEVFEKLLPEVDEMLSDLAVKLSKAGS